MISEEIRTETDQMGRKVRFAFPPRRIISLVPSITEYLLDLGAPVVGRTRFCVHPQSKVQEIPKIGGTKKFHYNHIQSLKPDLIVGNMEENHKEGIQALEKDFPVWMSAISTLEHQYEMMLSLGRITGLVESAEELVAKVMAKMNLLRNTRHGKALYLIWQNPWMAVGKETYIDSFLNHLGYENCISDSRYPVLTEEEILALNPDVILLSSEPFPFRAKHQEALRKVFLNNRVELADGEMFSWYGSRMIHLQ